LKKFFGSRLFVLSVVIIGMFAVMLSRVFSLQVVNGEYYQSNFTMRIQKKLTVEAARGNIYDCEGRLLAYNELAYAVIFYDTYSSSSTKNRKLNAELAEIVSVIEANDGVITNNFRIAYDEEKDTFSFTVSGTRLKRFIADVFGKSSYDDLEYNTDFNFDEANATPEQVIEFLMHDKKSGFGIHTLDERTGTKDDENYDFYTKKMAYELVVLRYAINANRYTQYNPTTIAEDVSDRVVAYMNEHSDELVGVEISEETVRRYNYSEYFSSIIGYTGQISDSEYEQLSATDSSYTTNDIIGKTGLEQYYESYLRGTNGEREVYVDSVGRISEIISSEDSVTGCDLYLSIDAELQEAVYKLLEQELAGILYSNIEDGNIPVNDVYFALVNNNLIDIEQFSSEDATETEKALQEKLDEWSQNAVDAVYAQLLSTEPLINNDMDEALLDYFTCVMSLLREDSILLSSEIDTDDEVYINWRNGKLSPREYLNYCISQQWIDIALLSTDEKYADSSEVYQSLCEWIATNLPQDLDFKKILYKYMIEKGDVKGRELCLVLFDQNCLDYDDASVNGLTDGTLSASAFLLEKINNIEITPAQLALDPCTASTIITDVNTGQIKALVSYPGYDNNRLANGVDADYFNSLNADLSNPQYNYATQEKTAPGSTFKMVTATAGLAENVIDLTSQITCTGQFMEISNTPKCWKYPGNHGTINVSEALRDSCNYFFYTVGYNLSLRSTGVYDDALGISYIQKYASLYGLDEKTGLEIEENTPEIADSYPVMAAIGQSNNNYTTASLSRYVTAVTSGKLYKYQLMESIVGSDGSVIASYEPESEDISDVLDQTQWDAIYSGMRMVVENQSCFDDFPIAVAGKTGTAQQVESRPNHALFVGFAPYENPEITIATRIAYGYTSHNAAAVARNILSYYFEVETLDELLSANAAGTNASAENTSQD
jgi:penicillin-binding protein 2